MMKTHNVKVRQGRLSYGLLAMIMVLNACSNQSAQINIVEPLSEVVSIESYELKNCESLNELHEPLTTKFQLKRDIYIADEATSLASGEIYQMSATEIEELTTLVEDAYLQIYQTALAEFEMEEFVVPKDREGNFLIHWNQKVYKSSLIYDFQGKAHRVEYQYILTIPEISRELLESCKC